MSLTIQKIVTGAIEENCWIVSDETGRTIVIDPGDAAAAIVEVLADRPVEWILLTHDHYDHIFALPELVQLTRAPVAASSQAAVNIEQGLWTPPPGFALRPVPVDRVLGEGDCIEYGQRQIQVLATPGHTTGSLCYLLEDNLFTGDTLFHGNHGRTDFPTGDPVAMSASLRRLSQLPPTTQIRPGHGPDWTIGAAADFDFPDR